MMSSATMIDTIEVVGSITIMNSVTIFLNITAKSPILEMKIDPGRRSVCFIENLGASIHDITTMLSHTLPK